MKNHEKYTTNELLMMNREFSHPLKIVLMGIKLPVDPTELTQPSIKWGRKLNTNLKRRKACLSFELDV